MGVLQDALSDEFVETLMLPISATPKTAMSSSYFEIVDLLTKYNIGAVFIVDSQEKLVGVITDGDVRRVFKAHGPIPLFNMTAQRFATKQPIVCKPKTHLYDALGTMELSKNKITCLPVVNEEEKLLGVVTLHAVISWLLDRK